MNVLCRALKTPQVLGAKAPNRLARRKRLSGPSQRRNDEQ